MANKVEVFLGGQDNLSPIFQKAETGFRSLVGAFALGNIAANLVTTTFYKLTSSLSNFAKQAVAYSARVEELNIIVQQVGKNAGYSAKSVDYFVESIKSAGISTAEATTVATRMMQNNLDMSKSFDLARLAQDAATIAGVDSSEALERIIHGIVTLQPEVLRNMGIMVNLEKEYSKFAKTTNLTSKDLSGFQKQQIAMNAVLAQSTNIAGLYTGAMDTSSKQLRSFTRYVKEIYEALGKLVLPVYHEIIFGLKDLFEVIRDWLGAHKKDLEEWSLRIVQTTKDLQNLIVELRNLAGLAQPLLNLGAAITKSLFNKDMLLLMEATYKSLLSVAHGFNILWYGAQGNFDRARQELEMMKKSAQESEAILKKLFLLPEKVTPPSIAKTIKEDPEAAKKQALAEAKAIIDRQAREAAAEQAREQAAKAAQKRLEEQAKLQTETTQKIMELTLEETDFKIWKVDEAYKKEQQLAKGNKALLAQLETAYHLELTKLATEYVNKKMEEDEKYGEWFHEQQMEEVEKAKQSIEARLAAYQELYNDLREFGVDDLEFTKEMIEKKRIAFIEASVSIVDANKWAQAETQKAWEDWTLRFGTILEGVSVYFARISRELYTTAKAGADMAKIVGDSFEEMTSDLFNNKLKTFADYWIAFWNQMGQIAAKLIRSYLEDAINSAIKQTQGGGGSNILGTLLKGAVTLLGGLFGGGSAAATGNAAVFSENIGLAAQGWAVPAFAAGGIVTKPTLAMVGESGDEAIIPLNKMGGSNINIFHIIANDAASFMDMCQRSPGGIVRVVHETLKEGGGLRNSMIEALY